MKVSAFTLVSVCGWATAFVPTTTYKSAIYSTSLRASEPNKLPHADEWSRQGLSFVVGALLSTSLVFAPMITSDFVAMAAVTTTGSGTTSVITPKEKEALDSANAALSQATTKAKNAKTVLQAAQSASLQSQVALDKAGSGTSSAKRAFLDANDKLAKMAKEGLKQGALTDQKIKVAETKEAYQVAQRVFESAKAKSKEDAAALKKAEKVYESAEGELKKAKDNAKSAEQAYLKYKERVVAEEKKARELKAKEQKERKEREKKAAEAKRKADEAKRKEEVKRAKIAAEQAKKKKEFEEQKLKKQREIEKKVAEENRKREAKIAAEKSKKIQEMQKEIKKLEDEKKAAEKAKTDSARAIVDREAKLAADRKKLEILQK